MSFKYRALSLACFAALGMSGTAQAAKVAGDLLEVYGNIYPQFQSVSFSGTSPAGSEVSTLTRGRTGAQTVTVAAAAVDVTKLNPVNSYIGFKGQTKADGITMGYDVQGVLSIDNSAASPFLSEARDAFVYVSHPSFGQLQAGQQDTYFKMNGDKVRMLGVSSSNFVSSANVTLNPTWRSATGGVTSFNTRINGQFVWVSPRVAGFEVGVSTRPDPTKSATRNNSLSAMGINWTDNTYFAGVAQETHNDFYAFSGTGSVAAAGSILNAAAGLRSKDTATRFAFGYNSKGVRVGADFVNLEYNETSAQANGFQSYKTNTWQVTGEYDLSSKLTMAANYSNNSAGTCTLNGTLACSTVGLGGNVLGFGAKYNLDRNFAFFALAAKGSAKPGGIINLGSGAGRTAAGGNITAAAVGVQARF